MAGLRRPWRALVLVALFTAADGAHMALACMSGRSSCSAAPNAEYLYAAGDIKPPVHLHSTVQQAQCWDAGARQLSAAAPAPFLDDAVSAASQGAAPLQAAAVPAAAPVAADSQSTLEAEAAAFVNSTELFLAGAREARCLGGCLSKGKRALVVLTHALALFAV